MNYVLLAIESPIAQRREVTEKIDALQIETYTNLVEYIADIGSKNKAVQILAENVLLFLQDDALVPFSELLHVLKKGNCAYKYTIFQSEELKWHEVPKNEVYVA